MAATAIVQAVSISADTMQAHQSTLGNLDLYIGLTAKVEDMVFSYRGAHGGDCLQTALTQNLYH